MPLYSIKQALNQFITQDKKGSTILSQQLKEYWRQRMGPAVDYYTSYIEVKNEILFIHISDGSVKQNIYYQKEMIMNEINAVFFKENKIKKIIIQSKY